LANKTINQKSLEYENFYHQKPFFHGNTSHIGNFADILQPQK